MDINGLIEQYGYAALVIGSVAEGETITLLGGVAAHQGLLKFPLVVAAVALGGMIGDQLLYFWGCASGRRCLSVSQSIKRKSAALSASFSVIPICSSLAPALCTAFALSGRF